MEVGGTLKTQRKNQKPNIIVCMSDQLRPFELGCYGNSMVRTPHIDRLAAQGVRFDVAVSNSPVCMPARSCLLSGQHSRTCIGELGNEVSVDDKGRATMPEYPSPRRVSMFAPTLPEQLKKAGYNTAAIGKWHIQSAPNTLGFDHSVYPFVHHRHTNQTFIDHDGNTEIVAGYSVDHELRAVESYFREHREDEQPFFLYYNISPPHMPLADAPERYLQMYDPDEVALRPNVFKEGKPAHNEEWFKIYLWDFLYYDQKLPHTLTLPDGFDIKHLTALYYGAISWVDDCVGRLRQSLKESGLDENTVIVFLADHGDHLGSHHRFNKGTLFEEAIRIPMIFHAPGKWAAKENHSQVAQIIDVLPTLMDIAGAEIPDAAQGQSLRPILTGERQSLNMRSAIIETVGGFIGIRTPTHLYGMQLQNDLRRVENERVCYYDLERDPYQWSNEATDGEPDGAELDLRETLLAWHRNTPWLDVKKS